MERLRYIRERTGLTQEEVSELAGITQNTLSLAELGKRRPHGRTLRKIAKVLGVEVADFFEDAEPRPKAPAPAYPSHISDDDRRTLDALDNITRTLDHRLSTGTLDAGTREIARQYHDGIAPTLARIMHEEADALRRMHPEAHDVGPWATAGPVVERYIAVSMRVLDAGDDLDRKREEAYQLVS